MAAGFGPLVLILAPFSAHAVTDVRIKSPSSHFVCAKDMATSISERGKGESECLYEIGLSIRAVNDIVRNRAPHIGAPTMDECGDSPTRRRATPSGTALLLLQ
jgi:hypothetical protein